jgi:hypothetical protein
MIREGISTLVVNGPSGRIRESMARPMAITPGR